MKLEIKAYNVIYQDWGEEVDDFYLLCQIDIGLEHRLGSEIYSLDIISPKRLLRLVQGNSIEIGKGYFITSDYNQNKIRERIDKIIKSFDIIDENDVFSVFDKIEVYFRSRA